MKLIRFAAVLGILLTFGCAAAEDPVEHQESAIVPGTNHRSYMTMTLSNGIFGYVTFNADGNVTLLPRIGTSGSQFTYQRLPGGGAGKLACSFTMRKSYGTVLPLYFSNVTQPGFFYESDGNSGACVRNITPTNAQLIHVTDGAVKVFPTDYNGSGIPGYSEAWEVWALSAQYGGPIYTSELPGQL